MSTATGRREGGDEGHAWLGASLASPPPLAQLFGLGDGLRAASGDEGVAPTSGATVGVLTARRYHVTNTDASYDRASLGAAAMRAIASAPTADASHAGAPGVSDSGPLSEAM